MGGGHVREGLESVDRLKVGTLGTHEGKLLHRDSVITIDFLGLLGLLGLDGGREAVAPTQTGEASTGSSKTEEPNGTESDEGHADQSGQTLAPVTRRWHTQFFFFVPFTEISIGIANRLGMDGATDG